MAWLTPSLHPGGAERQMLILAERLPRDRFDLRFILIWERGEWAPRAEALGIPIDVLGLRPEDARGASPAAARAVARAVRHYLALARDVDLVDAWLIPGYTFAGFTQPVARVPVVIAGRRSLVDLYRRKSWFRKGLARLANRAMDAIVANSQLGASEAIAIEHVPTAKVHVIPNAVIPLLPDPLERARLRAEWGVGDDEIVVGSVANYKRGKGLEAIVEAASAIRRDAPNVRFVFVGEGPLRARLEEMIATAGLGSFVRLSGHVPDARTMYPAFDVAIHASDSEGLPNVVLEAASAGLPIIATAVGGTSEILTDGVDGILLRQATAAAIADAVVRLASDRELRGRLGAAAHERSLDFSPERLVSATASLYERLISEARTG